MNPNPLTPVRNAMTVDVEEHFQVSAFEPYISRQDWESSPSRVETNTHNILELFAKHNVNATFFILGWIAERNPQLIRRIVEAGHEVASHGYAHVRVTQQSQEAFREDVSRTKKLIEDASGERVKGYRAASFSIGRDNLWALDVLGETGYIYSSSINPVRHDLYGMPEAPRFPFRHNNSDLLELPISTLRMLGQNFPCGGGGFFRLLPYWYFKRAIKAINLREGQSSIFYFHPWEIDPGQPRIPGLNWKSNFRHYNNLAKTETRLNRLLKEFDWGRMDNIFLEKSQVNAYNRLAGDCTV